MGIYLVYVSDKVTGDQDRLKKVTASLEQAGQVSTADDHIYSVRTDDDGTSVVEAMRAAAVGGSYFVAKVDKVLGFFTNESRMFSRVVQDLDG